MDVKNNIIKIKNSLPNNVTLVAVSKTKPIDLILDAYYAGQKIFGENKVQEMVDKYHQLPKDIQWHLIGHLQTNKVKYIAPFVDLIHAVDSLKLLKEINKQAQKNDRIIDVLIQFRIAEEETKFGLTKNEGFKLLDETINLNLKNVRIIGVMGMATYTINTNQIRQEFKTLKQYFDEIKKTYFNENNSINKTFKHISMGMSGDYEIAIEEGSSMVRIGSKIFGSR